MFIQLRKKSCGILRHLATHNYTIRWVYALASLRNDVIHKRSKEAGDIQPQHANLKSKLCDISIPSDFDMMAARLHDLPHDVC